MTYALALPAPRSRRGPGRRGRGVRCIGSEIGLLAVVGRVLLQEVVHRVATEGSQRRARGIRRGSPISGDRQNAAIECRSRSLERMVDRRYRIRADLRSRVGEVRL